MKSAYAWILTEDRQIVWKRRGGGRKSFIQPHWKRKLYRSGREFSPGGGNSGNGNSHRFWKARFSNRKNIYTWWERLLARCWMRFHRIIIARWLRKTRLMDLFLNKIKRSMIQETDLHNNNARKKYSRKHNFEKSDVAHSHDFSYLMAHNLRVVEM